MPVPPKAVAGVRGGRQRWPDATLPTAPEGSRRRAEEEAARLSNVLFWESWPQGARRHARAIPRAEKWACLLLQQPSL